MPRLGLMVCGVCGEWVKEATMAIINVLNIQRIGAADRAKIEAVDPAVRLTDAGGWFDGEYRETWPAYTAARYLGAGRHRARAPARNATGCSPRPK